MLALLLLILVAAIVAGIIGLAVHTLHWLLWVALGLLIAGLVYGVINRVALRRRESRIPPV